MQRIHLDTSVVLRLLTQEPADQHATAAAWIELHTQGGGAALVSDLVLAETYFALQAAYGMTKADALASLRAFVHTPGIHASEAARVALETPRLDRAKPGFVDRLIHGAARADGARLLTFEKDAKRLPETVVLRPAAPPRGS